MDSPPTSTEYSIFYSQHQAETKTETSTAIQNSSVYYLQQQEAEYRRISTSNPYSITSISHHQNSDNRTKTTNTTLNSNEPIPLPPTTPITSFSSSSSSCSFSSSSSLETLVNAAPPLSLSLSSIPPPLLTRNSPPARRLNPADIRPHPETIDRTAPPPNYHPPLSRIEAAETLLEIRYGRQVRSREGTVDLELELERSPLLSSRPLVVQSDGSCVEGAAGEERRGGAVWGSRLRERMKKRVKPAT